MMETAAHLPDHDFPAAVAGHAQADDVTDATASPPRAIFSSVSEIDETAVAQPQAALRKRILRAFAGRGLLQSFEAKRCCA